MTDGTKAEFAREYGYSKAAVSQFDKNGRLVHVTDKLIDFELSMQRITDTSDPRRDDVRRRHAKNSGRSTINEEKTSSGNSFQNARTVREKYLALQAKLDYEKNAGLLVEKKEVEKILFERARQFRDGVMATSRRIAPDVIGKESITEIESIVQKELRGMLEHFAKLPVIE